MAIGRVALAEAAEVASGSLGALNATLGGSVDCLNYNTVSVHVTGTFVGTVAFEVSNDGTAWVATTLSRSDSPTTTATSTTAASQLWRGDIGARYFRVRMSAYTSGSAAIIILFASGSVTGPPVGAVSLGTAGTSAASIGKAEDAAAANGDTLVAIAGVRAPSTPTTPTSAAGDYGTVQLDTEGKLVITGRADTAQQLQANVSFTTTSDVALLAASGSGIRSYLDTLILENTGASARRVILKDGSTVVATFTIPAANTLIFSWGQSLRGTANTAWNIALDASGTVTASVVGYKGV